jgi:hypothetical protein
MTTVETLEWSDLWDCMVRNPGSWIPTTEQMYWDMLSALPPRRQRKDSFLVGEPDHTTEEGYNVYACFCHSNDRFYARYMTMQEYVDYFC